MTKKLYIQGILLSFILLLNIGCKGQQFQSQWSDKEIIVDGNGDEWSNHLTYFEDSRTGIGILNDDKYLYLYITSSDRHLLSQIRMAGFTVLFKSKSSKGKQFGIRFPLAVTPPQGGMGRPGDMDNEELDTAQIRTQMETSMQRVALIENSDTIPMQLKFAESLGVVVMVKPSMENFAYELKVPLTTDSINKYGIGMGKDTLLTVTLKTEEINRPSGGAMPGHGGGGPMGGGSMGPPPGGSSGMKPPSGGGPMGGGGPMISSPVLKQFKIDLDVNIKKQ